MAAKDQPVWLKNVISLPSKRLTLVPDGDPVLVHVINNSHTRLAFKLKTTRSKSLKPSTTCGFLNPDGGCASIRVAFKPDRKEKPLSVNDRMSIMMQAAPLNSTDWEACLIETPQKKCYRLVWELHESGKEEDDNSD